MILVQQRYESPNAERQAELDHCREINAGLKAFADVVLVDGAAKRWTFGDFFRLAAEQHPGEICVLANSDIAFDDSIALAAPLAEQGMLVTLSRWDNASSPSMEGRVAGEGWHFFSHSQDVWVFRAGGLPRLNADFQLGIPQCESRLAYEAAAAGVIVVNPALSIRCSHHHASAVRSWRRKDGYRGSRPRKGPIRRRWWSSEPAGFANGRPSSGSPANRAGSPSRWLKRPPKYGKNRSKSGSNPHSIFAADRLDEAINLFRATPCDRFGGCFRR
jgi:hypothetical protein